MYETEFLTAILTISGGIIIFVGGQIINRFMIDPIVSLKEEIGKVAYCLVYYKDICENPNDLNKPLIEEASKEIRVCASNLSAKSNAVWEFLLKLMSFPKKEDIGNASNNLLFLANCLSTGDSNYNSSRIERIQNCLKIKKIYIKKEDYTQHFERKGDVENEN